MRASAGRFPKVPIFAGGEHPTAAWDHSLRACPELTLCVLGEGSAQYAITAFWTAAAYSIPILANAGSEFCALGNVPALLTIVNEYAVALEALGQQCGVDIVTAGSDKPIEIVRVQISAPVVSYTLHVYGVGAHA